MGLEIDAARHGRARWAHAACRRFTHRSPAGPSREVVVAGVPACARCLALVAGTAVGMVVATAWTPPLVVLVVFAAPAVFDAVAEKWIRRPHCPRRLLLANLALGAAGGAGLVAIVHAHGVATAAGLILLARVGARALRRARPRAQARVATEAGA